MVLRRIYIVLILGATLLAPQMAFAQNAVGLTLGGPTYIHFTHSLEGPAAAEAGVSFSYNNATHIYGDYLIQTHDPLNSPQLRDVGLFYGIGGIIVINNKDRANKNGYYGDDNGSVGFGVRFPVGLDWRPAETQKFSFHLQIVPIIAIVPETELEFNAGIGLKYRL